MAASGLPRFMGFLGFMGREAPDANASPPGTCCFSRRPNDMDAAFMLLQDMNAAFTSYPRAARTYQQSQQSLRAQEYRGQGAAERLGGQEPGARWGGGRPGVARGAGWRC